MKHVKEKNVIIGSEPAPNGEYITVTDKETGVIISRSWHGHMSNAPGRPKGGRRKAWFFKLYRTNWIDIVEKKHLTPYEAGVFFMMLAYVDWQSNYLVEDDKNLNEANLADKLQIDRKQLRRTIEALNDKGLIAIVKRGKGRPNHIMLNSHIVFYGEDIKDLSEHKTFSDLDFKPKVDIKYREVKKE